GEGRGLEAPLPANAFARESLRDLRLRPHADEVEARLRPARRDHAPRGSEHVDVLVALEHADEERTRIGRHVDDVARERPEVGGRREEGGRLAPRLLRDERGGERRDGTLRVGATHGPAGDHVTDWGYRRPDPRPVEPRRGVPVAVDLDDELHRRLPPPP